MAKFCPLCQNVVDKLFIKSLYEPANLDPALSPDVHTLVQRFAHAPRNLDLISSSETCSLCSLIKDALYATYVATRTAQISVQDFESFWLRDSSIRLEARAGNGFRAPPSRPDGGLQLCSLRIDTSHGYYLQDDLAFYAAPGSPASAAGDVFGIGPLIDSSSDASLSMLQGWMAECVSDHSCGCLGGPGSEDATSNPELPTRILEIITTPGPPCLRLIESRGMRSRYAALSHCWGPRNKQPLRTTKATYAQHLAGIAAADLPKTFREATRVAQAVGLRYIWIDSLCIIQDDRADWAAEAPRMGPLYGRAALVIAASGATDSTQGCFLPRLSSPELRIPYPATAGEGGGQEAHVVLRVKLPSSQADPIYSPLGKRGWVLQEWLLARRLVHYSGAGLTWTCQRVEDMSEAGMHESRTWAEKDMTWDSVIESFTIRQLTVLSDKTVAVQGLADSMQRNRQKGDAYHHGVWTADMPQQLLWVGAQTTRPKELGNIVPSWSWASTDGRCMTLSKRRMPWEPKPATTVALENGGRELVVECRRARRCALKRWKELTWDIVREEAPFSNAYAPTSIMNLLRFHFSQKMTYLMLDEDTGETVGVAMLDDDGAAGDRIQGCSIAVLMREVRGEHDNQPELTSVSLVLQEVASSVGGTYKRLGVGFVVDEAWIQGGAEAVFRIC